MYEVLNNELKNNHRDIKPTLLKRGKQNRSFEHGSTPHSHSEKENKTDLNFIS